MRKLLKHPFIVIGISVLLTVAFAFPLRKIKIESSIRQFFPQKHEAFQRLNATEDKFGSMLAIGVSLESPGETILRPEYVNVIRNITADLERLENAENITSLTKIDYIEGDQGVINVAPLFDKPLDEPVTEEDVTLITERLANWEDMYNLVVLSKDGRATQIALNVNHKATLDEQAVLLNNVRRVVMENIAVFDSDLNINSIRYYGDPVISEQSKEFMMGDLAVLIPLVILVVMVSLYFSFSTLEGMLLPLISVLMSTVWSIGLMTLLGFEFSMVSSVIPVALIGCGSAYGIHVLTHYYIAVDERIKSLGGKRLTKEDHLDCIVAGMKDVRLAVVLSAITTVVGFSSLVTSPLRPLFGFAIFTAIGIAYSLLTAVTVIPAFLTLKPLKRVENRSRRMEKLAAKIRKRFEKTEGSRAQKGENEKTTLGNTLYMQYHFLCGTKPRMIVFSIAIIVLSAFGLSQIVIDTSMVNYFPETSQLRRDIDYVNENFAGTNSVYLLIKSPAAKLKAEANALYDEAQKIADRYGDGAVPEAEQAKIADLRAKGDEKMSESRNSPDMTNPDVLKAIDVMEDWITDKYPLVGKAVSYTDSIKRINQTWNAPGAQAAPADASADAGDDGSSEGFEDFDDFGGFGDDAFGDSADAFGDGAFGDSADAFGDGASEGQDGGEDGFADFYAFEDETEDGTPVATMVFEDPNVAYQAKLERQMTGREVQELIGTAYAKAGGRRATVEDFVKTLQREMNYNGISFYEIPYDPAKYQKAQRADLAGLISNYTMMLGDSMERFTDDQVNFTPTEIRMQVQIKTNSTQVLGGMLGDFEKYARTHLPEGYTMEATGEGEMEHVMTGLVVSSQITSLLLSLSLVFVIITISFRSPIAGLIGAIPLAFTIILNYMAMGIAGIKLDLFTSIIASVAIGVGIDYTIHFMTEYKSLRMQSDNLEEVTRGTLRSSGAGIITNALAVGLGFMVLCLSRFVVLRYIGILVAIVMFTSSMLAMTILPGIFNVLDPKFMHPGKPKAWEDK